ncbi:MAG: type II secretion system F family protein [Lachnospiraceae bacterium]|nr:type II secretion system F family protein [Lachnospiraceae bacterium]
METYKYKGRTSDGRVEDGLVEAYDRLEAIAKLRNKYDAVLEMKETGTMDLGKSLLSLEIGGKKLNSKAFTLMCSQFATILKAGIPIARAVHLIADKTSDKKLKTMLEAAADDVEAGRMLSASLEAYGKDFLPPTFIETLAAGEESGDMAGAFESIYHHFDKQTKMNDKVKSAMAYPMFVLVIAVAVVIVLMVKVVPTFTSIFSETGGELPFLTQLLISISDFVRNTFVYFLVIAAIVLIMGKLWSGTENGKTYFAKLQLKLPILGNIAQLNAASLFANTLSTMIGAGLPMTKAISITSSVMPNYIIRKKVEGMVTRIEEGHGVAESMKEADCLPDILTDMVGVGEDTGEMQETLDTVAGYYDNELALAIESAISKMEPAMLIFIAFIAGFIVIAIYMAMFTMYEGM